MVCGFQKCVFRPREANKEGSSGDTWISLEEGNRIDFVGRLGVGEDGNWRDRVEEGEMEEKSTGRNNWNGEAFKDQCGNLVL